MWFLPLNRKDMATARTTVAILMDKMKVKGLWAAKDRRLSIVVGFRRAGICL